MGWGWEGPSQVFLSRSLYTAFMWDCLSAGRILVLLHGDLKLRELSRQFLGYSLTWL